LLARLGRIPDPRHPNKCRHRLTVLLLYGLLMFVFQFAHPGRGQPRADPPPVRGQPQAAVPRVGDPAARRHPVSAPARHRRRPPRTSPCRGGAAADPRQDLSPLPDRPRLSHRHRRLLRNSPVTSSGMRISWNGPSARMNTSTPSTSSPSWRPAWPFITAW